MVANCEFRRCELSCNIAAVDVLGGTVAVTVDVLIVVVDEIVVVDDFTVTDVPEAASAFLVLSVASIKVTTGGVTTANRPHCSRNDRRSALSCSFFCSSSAI